MTIAVGNTSEKGGNANAVHSWAHTIGAGEERLLLVGIVYNDDGGSITCSGVTYGGTALTLLKQEHGPATLNVALYYLKAPPVGTNNIEVTLTSGTTVRHHALDLSLVEQGATTFNTAVSAIGTDNTPTVAATALSADDFTVDIAGQNPTTFLDEAFDPGSGQTLRGIDFSSAGMFSGMSSEVGTGVRTMSWVSTATGTHPWAIVAAAIAPSVASTSALDASTTIAEIRGAPLRSVPRGSHFPFEQSKDSVNHQGLQWAVSGYRPTLFRARLNNDELILDSLWSVQSDAPAGAMAVTQLPTPASRLSLVVTTQDAVVQYPLPPSLEPVALEVPDVARSAADIPCAAKLSDWDEGDGPYHLAGFHMRTRGLDKNVDYAGISWAWDDTNAWSPILWLSGDDLWFSWRERPRARHMSGHVLKVWTFLYDANSTDTIPAGILSVKPYVKKVDTVTPQPPAWSLNAQQPEPQ